MTFKMHTRFLVLLFLTTFLSCNIEPFDGEIIDQSNSLPANCENAVGVATVAAVNYINATPTDANFSELCVAYRMALENQLTLCGDQGGEFQLLIDNLGDCEGGEENVAQQRAFMTANIAGEQFDDLKPNGYNILNKAVGVVTFSGSDVNYLRIQSNSEYQSLVVSGNAKEITLFIPETIWKEGV
jgi:hypothetical protein